MLAGRDMSVSVAGGSATLDREVLEWVIASGIALDAFARDGSGLSRPLMPIFMTNRHELRVSI